MFQNIGAYSGIVIIFTSVAHGAVAFCCSSVQHTFSSACERPFPSRMKICKAPIHNRRGFNVFLSECSPTSSTKTERTLRAEQWSPAKSDGQGQEFRDKIVLWRGEKAAGYSEQFRHLELSNVMVALGDKTEIERLTFTNVLACDGDRKVRDREVDLFDSAMQFVAAESGIPPSHDALVRATERCSLIRETYEVLNQADTLEDLADLAIESNALKDFFTATWRVRLRQFGPPERSDKKRRYGKNARSSLRAEKEAINSMAKLFIQFVGKVSLEDPECNLYIFEGTKGKKFILARLIAKGAKTSDIAPRSRICVTNTPLEEVAAFSLANFARVKNGDNVLDPYAGSCATLLAAAFVAPQCNTVGIEIGLRKFVKKDDILADFSSRALKLPAAIIGGDSMNKRIRDRARRAVGVAPFDAIVTDPPYGIREKHGPDELPPLVQLLDVIIADRETGAPLLRKGGRLVAFVPVTAGQEIKSSLPSQDQLDEAGLEVTEMREQLLSDTLSRWLVALTCTR